MNRIVFLGTSRCLPTENRDNTSILFETDNDALLVDCGGKPYQKLLNCHANLENLSNIVISHYHVDHCYGLPSLLSSFHLSGRERAINVLGLPPVIDKLSVLMSVFDFPETWEKVMKLYPFQFVKVAGRLNERIYDGPGLEVFSCVNGHLIQNLSIKVRYKKLDRYVVYTSDTSSPNENILKLSHNADYLIQEVNFLAGKEAQGAKDGHTTTAQAGDVARMLSIEKLFLIHHGLDNPAEIRKMREEVGKGNFGIHVPDDMEVFELS